MFLTGSECSHPTPVDANVTGSINAVKVNCVLLSKSLYYVHIGGQGQGFSFVRAKCSKIVHSAFTSNCTTINRQHLINIRHPSNMIRPTWPLSWRRESKKRVVMANHIIDVVT